MVVHGLLTATASRVAEHALQPCGPQQLWHTGSIVVVLRLSCPKACGIFLARGWNLRTLHWQADSYPLCHQGSPEQQFMITMECEYTKGQAQVPFSREL